MPETHDLTPGSQGSQLPVISLFSGAGGLDLAVERVADEPLDIPRSATLGPFRVAVATDYSSQALETLALNLPGTAILPSDIRDTPSSELLRMGSLQEGDAALVIGGPPCTPFSKSGFWLAEKRESRDPNASLLEEYVRVVAQTRPEAFVLENVQALTYRTHQVAFSRLLAALKELGYNPQWKTLLAADFGVPQLRKRVFIVGRRDGTAFEFPEATHAGPSETTRVWDQSKLPHVTAAQAFQGLIGVPEDGELVEGKYGDLAAEIPGGQNYLWHTDRYGGRDEFKWRSRYWTFLLRLSPEKPSSTLQAQPGPYVGPFHWENGMDEAGRQRARRLRVPEMLRLMTFPDDFQIVGSRADVQRQIGNAVPMELGKAVLRALSLQLGHVEPRTEAEHEALDRRQRRSILV
ncbi:DNA (cytosine-5-)-methyltransferase [Curtobacterium sp. 'Ferrero']|uniref:DNA cytosine methyltransferase n=1 Tax=Curtobacterium sp. 'Ferrero' TaxID=2033654 RepID=UPI000BC5A856|nr:DNA cytosine methyltransferase [Curtobacterium sp. 'Ferrero']PCN48053.1 DNA (cytosine-5-)-methyltransferase [Curtobacterium sp. 'Ferrero']